LRARIDTLSTQEGREWECERSVKKRSNHLATRIDYPVIGINDELERGREG